MAPANDLRPRSGADAQLAKGARCRRRAPGQYFAPSCRAGAKNWGRVGKFTAWSVRPPSFWPDGRRPVRPPALDDRDLMACAWSGVSFDRIVVSLVCPQ